jgi:hypothetical protein
MRRLPVFLVLTLSVGNLHALKVPDKGETQQEAPPQTREQKATTGQDKSTAPSKSYKPSEKITADSAVSFPVDI